MLRSYSLKYDQGDKLLPLMVPYRNVINSIINDIWNTIEWKEKSINGKQIRIIPYYEKSRELRGAFFECNECKLRIDRQLNAAINLYLKMEGVPHEKKWWDRNILPTLMGGYFLAGAEQNGTDELVRSPYEAVRPELYYAYDRYEDAYLRMPM